MGYAIGVLEPPIGRSKADLYILDMSKRIPGGVVHELPTDLREALSADVKALAAWN